MNESDACRVELLDTSRDEESDFVSGTDGIVMPKREIGELINSIEQIRQKKQKPPAIEFVCCAGQALGFDGFHVSNYSERDLHFTVQAKGL